MSAFIKIVKDHILPAKRIVILTGAVVSEESGVVTFRTPGEKFENVDTAELSSIEGFLKNPERVWAWYQYRRRSVATKGPNKAHVAITQMQKLLPKVSVITQNVDLLHQRAHTQDVIQLRGNFFENHCSECKTPYTDKYQLNDTSIPICKKCGGLVRPSVVWFGEEVDHQKYERSMELVKDCDFLLLVGIYGEMFPGMEFLEVAKNNKVFNFEINPHETILSSKVDYYYRGQANKALPALVNDIKQFAYRS